MKDDKGHGSNARGTGAQGMRLVKTHVLGPHSAKVYKNPEWGENVVKTFRNGVYQPNNDYHTDDMADAHGTAQSQLKRWSDQDVPSLQGSLARGQAMRSAGDGGHVPGFPTGNPAAASELASGPKSATVPIHDGMAASDAVNRAIQNSPTGSISGREAHDASRGKSWVDPAVAARFKRERQAAEGFKRGQREINALRKRGK